MMEPSICGNDSLRDAGLAATYPGMADALLDEVNVLASKQQRELHDCIRRFLGAQRSLGEGGHVNKPIFMQDDRPQTSDTSNGVAQSRWKTGAAHGGSALEGTGMEKGGASPPHQVCLPSMPVITSPQPVSAVAPTFAASSMKTNDTSGTATANKGKKKKKKKRVQDCVLVADRTRVISELGFLQRMMLSRWYEWFSGGLIILNATFIGWQAQWQAEVTRENAALGLAHISPTEPVVFPVLSWLFTIAFSIELGLRMAAEGHSAFIQGNDKWWNLFDTVIVSFSVVDQFLDSIVGGGTEDSNQVMGNVSILRVMRVVRIVRVARVIRVMKFFRELRIMVFSILGSFKSLVWVTLVLLLLFYIFGISLTMSTVGHLSTAAMWTSPDNTDLVESFGTVDRSIISLYMSMSGGNDWSMYYFALMDLPMHVRFQFLVFITFSVFAVVNIVTGVFVENAIQNNMLDREVLVQEELEVKRSYLGEIRAIFEDMDADETGFISQEEFEAHTAEECVVAYFRGLGLDVSDARMLFMLLDYDHSGEIEIDEFLDGCYKLQGQSTSLDAQIMAYEMRFLKEEISAVRAAVEALPGRQAWPTQ